MLLNVSNSIYIGRAPEIYQNLVMARFGTYDTIRCEVFLQVRSP
jgi:hypothetical protein